MISNELKKRIIELDRQADPFNMDILINLIDFFLEDQGLQGGNQTPTEAIDDNTKMLIIAEELNIIRNEIKEIKRRSL